jgi:hypothetical protein
MVHKANASAPSKEGAGADAAHFAGLRRINEAPMMTLKRVRISADMVRLTADGRQFVVIRSRVAPPVRDP